MKKKFVQAVMTEKGAIGMESDEIEKEYYEVMSRLSGEASIIVEREARKILAADPNLHEFVMGMGVWGFWTHKGIMNPTKLAVGYTLEYTWNGNFFGRLVDIGRRGRKAELEFAEMMERLDEIFGIFGEPMRFTADGPKVTNW